MGSVEAIFLRPAARLPVRSVDSADAVSARGLDGDHTSGGKRQVTVLSLEAWRDACAELGREVDPSVRRANILVAGVDLTNSIGRPLRVGGVVIDGVIAVIVDPVAGLDRSRVYVWIGVVAISVAARMTVLIKICGS